MGLSANWVQFRTPLNGMGFPCEALIVEDRSAVIRLRTAGRQPIDADNGEAFPALAKSAQMLNELLRAGLPWRAIALCRASAGTLGALIEAAENRRLELGGAPDA